MPSEVSDLVKATEKVSDMPGQNAGLDFDQ